jgi:hypothetical protein
MLYLWKTCSTIIIARVSIRTNRLRKHGPEVRYALGGDNGYFAVEVGRSDLETGEDGGDRSEARRPVVGVAGGHADVAALDPGGGSVAVDFHLLESPSVAGRSPAGGTTAYGVVGGSAN